METQPAGDTSHQTREHGNIVGTGKPGRVAVIAEIQTGRGEVISGSG